eukprot:TRINITY_DN5107_c0_g1_i1.p1 TRINITY_DN5107_c0_g1~~TRINITY_DN5107_c0_g1_i1.p1  ORF type:complete len:353 (-),score=52.34 TRINITY_DN5107_c0_g1_i1:121-1179(-)
MLSSNTKEGKNTYWADIKFALRKLAARSWAMSRSHDCLRKVLVVLGASVMSGVVLSFLLTGRFSIDRSLVVNTQPFRMPKIIHQSWKTRNVVSFSSQGWFSYPFSKWIPTWIKFNPQWKYYFWTDVDNERLFRETPELNPFLDVYINLFGHIERADFVRYAYMYVYGGIYADLDFECTYSLDYLALSFDAFVSSEPWEHSRGLFDTNLTICNAILGSRPNHPFWLHVMRTSEALKREGRCINAVFCTGPGMLHQAYMTYVEKELSPTMYTPDYITLLPSDLFYPKIAYNNIYEIMLKCWKKGLFCGRSALSYTKKFAVHHWACTYCEKHKLDEVDISTLIPSENLVFPFDQP